MEVVLFSFVISLLGSLPPGLINLSILQLSISFGWSKVLYFILIALLAETVHIYVSILIFPYLVSLPLANDYLKYIAILFLLIPGSIMFLKPQKISDFTLSEYFLSKFLLINLLNPAAIPFWIFYISYLRYTGLLKVISVSEFILGAIAGTFIALLIYLLLGKKLIETHRLLSTYINKIIGVIMLSMASVGLVRIFI